MVWTSITLAGDKDTSLKVIGKDTFFKAIGKKDPFLKAIDKNTLLKVIGNDTFFKIIGKDKFKKIIGLIRQVLGIPTSLPPRCLHWCTLPTRSSNNHKPRPQDPDRGKGKDRLGEEEGGEEIREGKF